MSPRSKDVTTFERCHHVRKMSPRSTDVTTFDRFRHVRKMSSRRNTWYEYFLLDVITLTASCHTLHPWHPASVTSCIRDILHPWHPVQCVTIRVIALFGHVYVASVQCISFDTLPLVSSSVTWHQARLVIKQSDHAWQPVRFSRASKCGIFITNCLTCSQINFDLGRDIWSGIIARQHCWWSRVNWIWWRRRRRW